MYDVHFVNVFEDLHEYVLCKLKTLYLDICLYFIGFIC